jgi:hypothetical protein
MTLPFAHLFFEDFFFEDFFFGTLPPSFRASDNPIAIACFLLVTFLPDLPLFQGSFFALMHCLLNFLLRLLAILGHSSPASYLLFVVRFLNGVGVGLAGSGSGTGVGVVLGEGLGNGIGVAVGVGVG